MIVLWAVTGASTPGDYFKAQTMVSINSMYKFAEIWWFLSFGQPFKAIFFCIFILDNHNNIMSPFCHMIFLIMGHATGTIVNRYQ